MEGSGLPLAWHIRVTLEPSFTTISRDRLMIFGGTVKANEKWVNLIKREAPILHIKLSLLLMRSSVKS